MKGGKSPKWCGANAQAEINRFKVKRRTEKRSLLLSTSSVLTQGDITMDIAEDVKGGNGLKPYEQLAVDFLARNGTDCVGVIDDEEKLAAAWVYVNLHTRGYLIATIGDTGPVYRLTSKGRAIASAIRSGERG